MIIDNKGDSMIKFRLKQRTYSQVDDIVLKDPTILKVVNMLDKNRVSNYGLSISIPDDVISINYGSRLITIINIPIDLNQFQYDIEDYLLDHKPRYRYSTTHSRNLLRFIVKDPIVEKGLYDLMLYLIDRVGYVVLCPEERKM